MATYVPPGFRVLSALSGSVGVYTGPTTIYTAPPNSVALLNIVASAPLDSSSVSLAIGGATVLTINRTTSTNYTVTGVLLFLGGTASTPPNSVAFFAVIGPGQSLTRNNVFISVSYSGALLGT